MAKQVKKDDNVVVIAGADKGKRGQVLRVDRAASRIVVKGINIRKKTTRRSAQKPSGGIESVECPLHISNVMLEEVYNARHAAGAKAADAKKADAAPASAES